MPWEIEITLLVFLVVLAYVSLAVRNLLAAVVALTGFSFISALIYTVMGAVDVGFTEAVIGAGISGVLLVIAIYHTSRRSLD